MKPAIEIQNLSKEYAVISSQRYIALRDVLADSVKKILNPSPKRKEKFRALENIDFSIHPGERVGIIGRNGAGKSTLLKIISRITPPTTGQVTIRGRVGSLLEVGTGFHPELTGRENIYLNGSILGLKRKEINQQLEAIIDFSGVEKFMDMPLKHFSSGMQLRLAFAVAAHLEPEILLIDEVLAVGDLEFQRKCIGKMEEVSREHGRTILFVSHNMGLIKKICDKTLYLEKGSVKIFDQTGKAIEKYLNDINSTSINTASSGLNTVKLNTLTIRQQDSRSGDIFLGYEADILLDIFVTQHIPKPELALNIRNSQGVLTSHITTLDNAAGIPLKEGQQNILIRLSAINFSPGEYTLDFFVLSSGDLIDAWYNCTRITVLNSDKAQRPGGFPPHVSVFTDATWHIE